MDQKAFKQWENRCIQEEPPECTAACPLHVDVRGFVGHVRAGQWQAAWQLLTRVMPIAGILGRICDAPCQTRCKRKDAGNAIRIGALECACVQQAADGYQFTPLPAKGKSIAVVGSGLSSLTVAWDMVRKGYTVTLFDSADRPGAALLSRYKGGLSQQIITREMSGLKTWGVGFEAGVPVHSTEFYQQIYDAFDGLYIGLDTIDPTGWPLARDADGSIAISQTVQTTGDSKVFAGGRTVSPILQTAQGRWAATTIDRSLQRVSLTAGREKQGPCTTRLYTSLKDVRPQPAVAMADLMQGYRPEEAIAEAQRCLMCDCMACVNVCPYLEHYGAYPRKYAREIFNNASMFMGARTANAMINSCSLCGLCETVCPEKFAMQDLCLQARRDMVANDLMPPSAHEFALEDMTFSLSEEAFLARHAPGTAQSRYLLFPGCQLCASSPDQTATLYEYLRNRIQGGVGLMLGCCGAPAHWSGQQAHADDVIAHLRAQWQHLGEPKMIVACSTCLQMFETLWPQAPVRSLWDTLEEVGVPDRPGDGISTPLAVHDPCTTRHRPAIQETVRRLVAALGIDVAELPLTRQETECCGYGGLMQNANPQIAKAVIERRAALSDHDYLTYCAMCRDSLAAAGKRSMHLLDVIFPAAHAPDPAARPRPGWSQRRENRARLKADLLESLWQEKTAFPLNHDTLSLQISPQVQTLLDEHRILTRDIQLTIAHAEAGGIKFRHPLTGRFRTCHRPRHVTFWVEYASLDDGGYAVFNAYSHRMEVHTCGGS